MPDRTKRRDGSVDFVASPPAATEGGFDQVCQITPYSVSGATPPALGGEFHDRAYDNQVLRVQTLGTYGDFRVLQDLVPGKLAVTKFSKSNSTDFTNCIEPKALGKQDWSLQFSHEVAEFVDTDQYEEIIERREGWPVKLKQQLPTSEYRYALKALDGVLPRALFENAVITGGDLIRGKPAYGGLPDRPWSDYERTTESGFHRDGIRSPYGWTPVGELLVFEPIDSTLPAKTITTEWVWDWDREQMYHSAPLSEGIDTPNARMTRLFVYVENNVIERVFPGMLVPKHKDGDVEEVSTDHLVNVAYVGGGNEIYLNPGERVVQAANVLPRLIPQKWVEDNWSLLYPNKKWRHRETLVWVTENYGWVLDRAEELGLDVPRPFEAQYESVPADSFPSQAKPPQQLALAGKTPDAPPPPEDLPALENNAKVVLSNDYQEESSNGKLDKIELKYIQEVWGYRDAKSSPLLPNETGVVSLDDPDKPNLYLVRSKDGKRWWQYDREALVAV
jgi:hypothetical protein